MRRIASLSLAAALFALLAPAFAAPLPYLTEPAFDKLSFTQPLEIATPPGETNRLFVLEKPGRIIVVPDLAHPSRTVFLDLTGLVGDDSSEQGVLALAFHPDYAHNRQFYVWYTSCLRINGRTVREDRLARFLVSPTDPNAADPASEQRLISQADEAPNHNGGQLLFGPDGYLYLSMGDGGGARDQFQNSQRIDKDFFSGILRIDVDQKPGSLSPHAHPSVHAGAYAVPPDNPFVGAKTFNGQPIQEDRVHTEYWAVGLRNPWRMSFDPATGWLWCGDVGQDKIEEVDVITRGGNYGWNYREATIPGFRANPPPEAHFIDPVWSYPHTQGLSITGGIVYRGKSYPGLVGKYLFADYVFGRIWALQPDGDKTVGADHVQLIAQGSTVVSFGLDPRNGDVLMTSLNEGVLLRLVPNPGAAKQERK
jgi:glucose/arabinose dehydrogenase